MFTTVAPRYDFINSLLSLGLDGLWRRTLAQKIVKDGRTEILDVACGSGAVVKSILQHTQNAPKPLQRLVGVDFCPELLSIARADKAIAALANGRVEFFEGDALALPFPDNTFDAVSVAFGLRNFADRNKFYAEALRVLKPDGRLYVLEFSQPHPWAKPFYSLYQTLIPTLAHIMGAPREAYAYLNSSINAFPNAPVLAEEITAGGFTHGGYKRLTTGVVAIHWGTKA